MELRLNELDPYQRTEYQKLISENTEQINEYNSKQVAVRCKQTKTTRILVLVRAFVAGSRTYLVSSADDDTCHVVYAYRMAILCHVAEIFDWRKQILRDINTYIHTYIARCEKTSS